MFLVNFREIYEILCRSIGLEIVAEAFLCWECMCHLKNVDNFRKKLKNSHLFLIGLSDGECQPTCLSNLVISEILTLDTFEKAQDDNYDTNDVDTETLEEELEEELVEKEVSRKITEEDTEKEDVADTIPKIEQKVRRKRRIFHYPKDRSRRYTMTYQSLKWNEAVQEIQINCIELEVWLERERNSDHFQCLKNKCNICLQKLRMDQDLKNHKREYHMATKSRPYTCDICNIHYPTKGVLRAHIKRHYFMRRCKLCGYECYSQLHMRYHLRKSHQRDVTCSECGEHFKNTRDFFVHLKSHTERTYYFCDQCEKKSRSLRCLEKHIQRCHMEQRCDECNITFGRHTQLLRHMRVKHALGPADAAYCAPCDKQFRNTHTYIQHTRTAAAHTRERGDKKRNKKVPCPVCLKVYSKNETMMNHYRWVHTHNSKYKCEQCDKSFLNRTKYKEHEQYVHLGLHRPRDKTCHFCNKGFYTNQALKHHILIHTGERPHHCPHCPQRFRQKAAMHAHVKYVHMKLDPHSKDDKIYVYIPHDDSARHSTDILY